MNKKLLMATSLRDDGPYLLTIGEYSPEDQLGYIARRNVGNLIPPSPSSPMTKSVFAQPPRNRLELGRATSMIYNGVEYVSSSQHNKEICEIFKLLKGQTIEIQLKFEGKGDEEEK